MAKKPTEEDFADWASAGASELIWGVPDLEEDAVLGYLDKLAGRTGAQRMTLSSMSFVPSELSTAEVEASEQLYGGVGR